MNKLSNKAREPSPNLGYILGVILGDGYFDRIGYRVMLECQNEEFAWRFAKNMEEWCGFNIYWREFIKHYRNRPTTSHCKKEYDVKMFKTGICSKEAYYFLKEMKNNWFTRIKDADTETKLALIKGFYDAEGSFSRILRKHRKYSYVKTHLSMANLNSTYLRLIGKLVEECLGIKLSLGIYPYECFLGTQDKKKAQIFLEGIGRETKSLESKVTGV